MSILSIENHVQFSLISLTVPPSTTLAIIILILAYFYILHIRKNPLPHHRQQHFQQPNFQEDHVYDAQALNEQQQQVKNSKRLIQSTPGRDRRNVLRPSIVERVCDRFRESSLQRASDKPNRLRLPFSSLSSLWLPSKQRQLRLQTIDLRRGLQPGSMETSRVRRRYQ